VEFGGGPVQRRKSLSKITTIARPALTSDHFTASAGLAAAGESRWLCEGAAAGRESERRRPEYYTWCLDQGLFAHTGGTVAYEP
jgi:hypothetical protein